MRERVVSYSLTIGFVLAATVVRAQVVAPDASTPGPYLTTTAEYKLPAAIDSDVATQLATELWARIYRPVDLSAAPYPLLVFLHGNHATCGRYEGIGPGRYDIDVQYTFSGTCPPGYVVVPSHEGYAYLAERLASWGYIVVSVNANRGVNAAPGITGDRGLNLRRGRLVLKHLQRLSEWNASGGAPASLGFDLRGTLDFQHVGMLGHSRGGEGVRAAYNLYREAGSIWPARIGPVQFEGIFEIGPVDGQTSRILNADGTSWNVLLPMCDGDVFNLQGVRAFDRMMLIRNETPATPKSTFTVWGANHNFYNTEWQLSDSPGCLGHKRLFGNLLGSPEQQDTALASVLAFFRGHVGATSDATLAGLFNPQLELPAGLGAITRIDRGFTESPSSDVTTTFDDFDQPTGFNTAGAPNTASNVSVIHGGIANHSVVQKVAQIAWSAAGASTFFQSNWTVAGQGRDASAFKTLDFRVARQCGDAACTRTDSRWLFTTGFSVRLVAADGTTSDAVRLGDYLNLTGPVGGLVTFVGSSPHPILQTVRIPLAAFGNAAVVASLRGVRFTFDETKSDEIFIGNIRLSTIGLDIAAAAPQAIVAGDDSAIDTSPAPADNNQMASIRQTGGVNPADESIEIELTSNREFLPDDELLVLRIGEREFTSSRYPPTGETTRVLFTLTIEEFAQLEDGAPVVVQYGSGANQAVWRFGRINKGQLAK